MRTIRLFFYVLFAIIVTACDEQTSIIVDEENLPFIEKVTDSSLQNNSSENKLDEESLIYKVENGTLHITLLNFPISCDCTDTDFEIKTLEKQIVIKPIEVNGGYANCFNLTNISFSIKNLIKHQTYSIKIEKTNYAFDIIIEEGNSGTILKELPDRDKAFELVKQTINEFYSLDSIDIYVSKNPIPASTDIKLLDETITSPATDSWLFFIDGMPKQNWGHPCLYIYIDKSSTPQILKKNIYPISPSIEDMDLINTSIISKEYKTVYIPKTTKVSRDSRSTSYNNNCYAVIISGGGNQSSNHIRYWNDCSYIYSTLINLYNYSPDNIYVFKFRK